MLKGFAFFILIVLVGPLFNHASAQYTTPLELSFTIYSDGIVKVDYYVEVDPVNARVNISLFNSIYEELLVLNQDGLPLDYALIDGVIIIDSLGSINLEISYYTPDITSKEGAIWSLKSTVPIPTIIILPAETTIKDLNNIPLAIGTLDSHPYVTMPDGEIEVAYTLGIVGSREQALLLINETQNYIEEAKLNGIILTDAENLLDQAKDAYMKSFYYLAEQTALNAQELAIQISKKANDAEEMINLASSSIEIARGAGKTSGLDEAIIYLENAQEAYFLGKYETALDLAISANNAALLAAVPVRDNNILLIGGSIIAVLIVLILFIRRFLFRTVPKKILSETRGYDIKAIFDFDPDLRVDDKEVIRYIVDRGGELFVTEIRDRFDLPRTSAWRLIRRLEGKGILEERKVGGQSLVKIRDIYIEKL